MAERRLWRRWFSVRQSIPLSVPRWPRAVCTLAMPPPPWETYAHEHFFDSSSAWSAWHIILGQNYHFIAGFPDLLVMGDDYDDFVFLYPLQRLHKQ